MAALLGGAGPTAAALRVALATVTRHIRATPTRYVPMLLLSESSQRHAEVRALVRGGIGDPPEAHVAAHLAERRPLVLDHPRLDFIADPAQVVRAVSEQRRHHLRRVGAGHRRLDDVEAGVDAAGD